ncbi:MAG: hypothetical protein M3328_15665 [Chloroflexota bacterium]|nr:hypothetical protein [Chloroflexota bacterium]
MSYNLPPSSPLPPIEETLRSTGLPPIPHYAKERPIGVTVLALLNFLGAGVFIFLAVSALLTRTTRPEGIFMGIIGAAICLPIAIGLWTLRQWARVMALIVYLGGATITLCANLNNAITGSVLLGLAITVGGAIYLLQTEADRAFGELPTE